MSAHTNCTTCGSPLSDSLEGLCIKCLAQLGFHDDADRIGRGGLPRLGDYELLEEIARGGMGVVYRARQLSLNRIVALKVLLQGPFSSDDFVRRFRREAEAVAALQHPNIVTIHEVGEHKGAHFLSLEFIDGKNLSELTRKRLLPSRTAAEYLRLISEAIACAHKRGVFHRDLKPSNILVDESNQPRVTDFGLAKFASQDPELTVTGQILGSPNYMSPEQAAGEVANPALADVYSLGAILYHLLTGRPPFQGETVQSILAQLRDSDPVPPRRLNPTIPENLQTICVKCLQREPGRRYDSAQQLADDLARFLDDRPILARPATLLEQARLWRRRRPLSAALALTVVLGMIGVVLEWRQAEMHARGESNLRVLAEQDAARTRLNLYAADIALASDAIHRGDYGLARRTLDALRPAPGQTDLRGFEWRYLWKLCRGDQSAALVGHSNTVTCVAFSSDGALLATGGQDGAVIVWDAAKRVVITNLTVTRRSVWSIGFSPDDKALMTGCNEKVELRDVHSWQVIATFPGQLAAFSKTGDLLAISESSPFYWEEGGDVKLWNWRTGQLLHRFEQPGRALTFSDDGELLAVAGLTDGIRVWKTRSGQMWRELPTSNSVWSLDFSPDGQRIVSAGWSPDGLVWNLSDNAPPTALSASRLNTWRAIFSRDGAQIAVTSSDQTVRLWNASTLELESTLHGHSSEVWCASFNPANGMLATGGKDREVLLWPVQPNRQRGQLFHDKEFQPVFSQDGKWFATIASGSTQSTLWNAARRDSGIPADSVIFGLSTNGQIAVAFDGTNAALRFVQTHSETTQVEVPLEGLAPMKTGFFSWAGMSPGQDFFFGIDANGRARVWNAASGRLLGSLNVSPPPIRDAMLGPGGRQLAVSVDREHVARLYDCSTGTERLLIGHRDFISGLAFSPDGSVLATGSMDGTIGLWKTSTGQAIVSLPGHMQETTDVAFSPDGRTLASLGQHESVKLWNLATLRELLSEDLPSAGCWLRFSPDGLYLAVTTHENKLRLFEAPTE